MKKLFLIAGVAIIMSVITGCQCPFCECKTCKSAPTVKSDFKMLSTEEFKNIVDKKSSLIFDARTGKYDNGERIPGAKSLSAASSAEEVTNAIPDKNASIVTYCANPKCPASAALAEHLKKLGYTNIMEYPEGIDGWIKAGNKVDKVK